MTFWEESLQRHEISFLLSIFQEEKREEVKEWVLAVSMDQKVRFQSLIGLFVPRDQNPAL